MICKLMTRAHILICFDAICKPFENKQNQSRKRGIITLLKSLLTKSLFKNLSYLNSITNQQHKKTHPSTLLNKHITS